MAFSCLAMADVADDIPCQPALLRHEKKSKFMANGLISNGYQSLSKARRLLANDLDSDFMNSLFSEDKIIEVETNPSLMFTSPYLSGKYLLYGLQFSSTQRNQANPEIQMFATDSKLFILQSAYSLNSYIDIGLQLRSQTDNIVKKTFRLVDLGTDNGKNLLKPQTYSRVFAEPGFAVTLNNWRFSVLGAGLIVSGDTKGDFEDTAEAQAGVGYSTTVGDGLLDLYVDYKSLTYLEKPEEKFHSGLRYRYGALSLLGGLDYFGVSGGVLFSIEKLYSGIIYSTSQVPWRPSEEYAQTTYIELGWQL